MTSVLRRLVLGLLVLGLLVVALGACEHAGDQVASPQTSSEPPPRVDTAPAPTSDSSAELTASPSTGPRPAATEAPQTPSDSAQGRDPREPADPSTGSAAPPPEWLGTRVLTPGPQGYAPAQPTPPELQDRRFITSDVLPPPSGEAFASTVSEVTHEVAARSTWVEECPVALSDLRYVTVSFWGFDDRPHTGELLVHRRAAEDLVGVFGRLFDARFPIEEMRITRADELDAPPTGDGNNTAAFVCRPSRDSQRWSEHAFGLAVDVNPFHNPLVKGDTILPELATAYADRTWERPGMVLAGSEVVDAFAAIGWSWGGAWSSLADYMHFSHNGR